MVCSSTGSQALNPQVAQATLERVIRRLAPQADAIFAHHPLIDPYYPATSDLDLLVFGEVDELFPQRLHLTASSGTSTMPMVDLIWLPRKTLDDPESFARNGLIPHRLLSSRVVYDKDGYVSQQCEAVRQRMYQPEIQEQRITGFLDMGFYTVREMGVTWDFPAMALFWLHVAHAACLAAMCDGMRSFCPTVYTRPLDCVRHLERERNLRLKESFIQALRLDVHPHRLMAPLRRIHEVVSSRFPEPDWPQAMRSTTRYEYRYFLAQEELDWRISVAEEMIACGDPAAAVYYLRFWAYTLARIPMVHQRAREGVDVSFVRPARAVFLDLEAHCPEILDDLTRILAGRSQITTEEVMNSLNMLYTFRERTLVFLWANGIGLPAVRAWRPFRPPPSAS